MRAGEKAIEYLVGRGGKGLNPSRYRVTDQNQGLHTGNLSLRIPTQVSKIHPNSVDYQIFSGFCSSANGSSHKNCQVR